MLFAVTILLSVVACSPGVEGGGEGISTKNSQQWSMPLDEYFAYSPEMGNYVEQLLIRECLNTAGYQWPVPWRNPEFQWPVGFNSAGVKLFNRDIAAARGYHLPPPRNASESQGWAEFGQFANSYSPDARFDSTFEECAAGARSEEGTRDGEGFNYVSDLGLQASNVALQDANVTVTVSAWRECLSPRVDFVVPQDPWAEMPPSAVAKRLGLYGPEATESASAEEIAIAVADAECRESSGFTAARYDAEWNHQMKLLAENRAQLDRIRADALAHKEVLLTIIAENAPPAP